MKTSLLALGFWFLVSGFWLRADPLAATALPATANASTFNVKTYGATGNGRVFRDGAVTSSSTTLTSASAAFTAADVGRTAVIELTSTSRQITTITSVTNGTTAVLAAAATGSASGTTVYLGTDDTTAIQNAINAAYSAGGGTVYFPASLYVLTGALQDTTVRNSVLTIPNPNTAVSDQIVTLVLRGDAPANTAYSGYFTYPVSQNGAVLYFGTPGSGTNPSAICGNTAGSSWTTVNFVGRDLNIRLPRNPTIGALNFAEAGGFIAEDVTVDADKANQSTPTVPSTNTVGLYLPGNSNNAVCKCDDVWIQGMGIGARTSDNAVWNGCTFAQCAAGLQIDEGSPTVLLGIHFAACPIDIYVNDTAANTAIFGYGVFLESDGVTTTHIHDPSNKLTGMLECGSDVALLNLTSTNIAIRSAGQFGLMTFGNRPFVNSIYSISGGLQLKPADSSGFSLIGFQSAAGVELGNFICNENFGEQLIFIARNGANVFVENSDGHGMEVPTGGNGDVHATSGSFITDTVGQTLAVKSGANAKAGTFTLTAGTVTVANTGVDANSVVIVTLKTAGGTRAGNPDIVPTAGTGFVATGGSSDTSTYNYVIVEVN